MTERKPRKRARQPDPPPSPPVATTDADEAERSLGRRVSLGLPLAALGAAVVVGAIAGLGSAMLVLAAGALLGTIGLLWASVRTLSGDAPLSMELEALAARDHGVDALGEQKRRVLRALKDLESEHAVGKIDDADYRDFVAKYREDAKAVMRKMDLRVAPLRAEAERLARDYLADKGIAAPRAAPGTEEDDDAPAAPEKKTEESEASAPARVECSACKVSNEADAKFCKKCGAALGQDEGHAKD
jgi:hypothetical protein